MNKLDVKDETPLKWPEGWSRTLIEHRKNQASWRKSFSVYRDAVVKELERMGVSAVTISRNDSGKERLDPGVAVWFSLKPASDFSWQSGLQLDNPIPSLDEIDSAFRRLAQKHHPDAVANGSGGDVAMFHKLSIAAIETAALDYAEIRDQRQELTTQESSLKTELLTLMHKEGKTEYKRGNITVKVVTEKENVKVRVKEEGEAADVAVDTEVEEEIADAVGAA